MKRKLAVLCLLAALIGVMAFGKSTPQEILKASDDKFIPNNFSYNMTIETENDEGKINKQKMNGYKKGSNKNVIITKEPKRVAGTVSMRKENSIWTYFSSNSRTMKSAFQSLAMGESISYGDILASELSYDYDIVKDEEKDGEYVFTLKPKQGHEGYAKVVIWIDQTTLLPKKREYYALSGVLLKVCDFKKIEFNDKKEIVYIQEQFYDPLKEKKNMVIIDNIKILPDVSEKYYNEAQLKFLSGE